MKAFKSMVLLTAGVLAFSACDKRKDNQTTATGTQDTTMGAGTSPVVNDPNANSMMNTKDEASGAGTGAALGTGAAAGAAATHSHSHDDDATSTSEGSGAVSDEAVSDELESDGYQDVDDEQFAPQSTDLGTGRSGDNYEMIDESSSEPDDVRGGRDARMVPKNTEIDNSSSEPDNLEQ